MSTQILSLTDLAPRRFVMRSDELEVTVAPEVGGRILQIQHLPSGYSFLWNNPCLELAPCDPGSEYDPNFFGGVDELLPNDPPETIDGIDCPDHGELWTTPLESECEGDELVIHGQLPKFGLHYQRRMSLRSDSPVIDLHYRIENVSGASRTFLWKLHAAMNVQQGDVIECPARSAQVVSLDYSRFDTTEPFAWPVIEGQTANVIPSKEGTVDFFYLYDLPEGRIAWTRHTERLRFEYRFSTAVFPYAWLFASYGGFDDHYTAILEPCTTMPMDVNEASPLGQCSRLAPGEVLETTVSIFAGVDK